jgi:DNA processing protein
VSRAPADPPVMADAASPWPCAACLRRAWLVARLAGHIERAWQSRRALPAVLSLPDDELIAALAGNQRSRIEEEHEQFCAQRAVRWCTSSKVTPICRCDPRYPGGLDELPDAPAVLHVLGDVSRLGWLADGDAVAIVGARRASPYGIAQAGAIARGLASARIPVVSGMALGVDSAAHAGALEAGGATVAVLAGGPERAYPASKRRLHERIAADGLVVSEMPPGTAARRWCFPARNRLIAALARVTVVVEAGTRSGSLITASLASDLGRDVAAVPGPVSAPLSAGTNELIVDGARLVRGPRDVLELLYGAAAPEVVEAPAGDLPDDLQALLERVGGGCDTVGALAAEGLGVDAVLAGLAQLELRGRVRRTPGGRYAPTA